MSIRGDLLDTTLLDSAHPWRDPSLPLGERCVALCHHELTSGVRAQPYGQPNTSARVREYLAGCVRDVDHDGDLERLGLAAGNWCAAAQSWVLEHCLLPGEESRRPHLWRAGVVELVADAREKGLYVDAREIAAGREPMPRVGDLVIWDRSDPERPETAWWRHVNRLVRWLDNTRFVTIGGNEGRAWRESAEAPKDLDMDKLIGFVRYPPDVEVPMPDEGADTIRPHPAPHPLTREERERLMAQTSLMLRDMAAAAVADVSRGRG